MKKKLSFIIPAAAAMFFFSVNSSFASVNLLEFISVVKSVDESIKTIKEKKPLSGEAQSYKLTQTNIKNKKEDLSHDEKG